jgi:hypothetical protein
MDHAKFCLATQGWSTPEWVELCALLRRCFFNQQEEDHGRCFHAMLLRGRLAAKVRTKLTV